MSAVCRFQWKRKPHKGVAMRKQFMLYAVIPLISLTLWNPAHAGPIPRITQDTTTEFGIYSPVVVDVTPSVKPYTVDPDLSNVSNIQNFTLTDGAKALLSENGFAAQASTYPQIYDVYNECESKGLPAFVTTDACLHTYHILYDYMLRILEHKYFIDDLDKLTRAMMDASAAAYETVSEPSVKQAALDNLNYLSVPYGILNPEASDYAGIAAQEITLIDEGSNGYVRSPLFYTEDYPYMEDYSQYKPRGHYTRSEEFKRYFRAMMWYGRITFSLDLDYATPAGLRHAARQALLIARGLGQVVVEDERAAEIWARIYEPTVFFVGKSDDITWQTYLDIAGEVFGADFLSLSPDVLADDVKMDVFIEKALDLPGPKITVKAGKGLRLMGQRYIPDSYMLDQLVFDYVDRLMPRGLDVMAVLGSGRAYEILDTVYQDTKLRNYPEQMAKLRGEFQALQPDAWAQNLYFNWLYTLIPLLDVKGDGYPLFMQSQAWVDKGLNSALGSWAELRHDTILYAKQSETLETASPSAPELVMGYVEPEPEVYARLAALADFMSGGLQSRGLLDDLIAWRLEKFESLMHELVSISVKELTNVTPSQQEFAVIANFGGTIEDIVTFPKEEAQQWESEADAYMAVIADVHTENVTKTALEVGVGHPLKLFVIAPVNGVPTLTKGGIFSYHEFIQPLSDGRLTDEEWQVMQSGDDAQNMPVWTQSFMDGPSSSGREPFPFPAYDGQVTSVGESAVPVGFSLRQNVPNPFNPSTLISFGLEKGVQVKLVVYNLSGQEVVVLIDQFMPEGTHSVVWSPDGRASGIYLVRLSAGASVKTIRAVYLK